MVVYKIIIILINSDFYNIIIAIRKHYQSCMYST